MLRRILVLFCLLLTVFLLTGSSARGEQVGTMPRIGYLSRLSSEREKDRLAAFRQGLRGLGYVENKNLIIEERYAKGNPARLTTLAAELIRLKVALIVTWGGRSIRAAQKASGIIPIVFTYQADPVGTGVVASLARPGGNVTGLSDYHGDLFPKRLELLKEVVPSLTRVAVLSNPSATTSKLILEELRAAAPDFGVSLLPLTIKSPDDVEHAFTAIKQERVEGFLLSVGHQVWQRKIVELAAKSRTPAVYPSGDIVAAGGVMSYGTSHADLFRRAAVYVDKILKGRKPADLPVERPVKFDLMINLKTATRIGLTIPPNVLARATEVIR